MYAIYGYTMSLLSIKAHVYGYSQEERPSLLFRYYAVKCPILHRRNKAKLRFFSVCLYVRARYMAKIGNFLGKALFLFKNFCEYPQTRLFVVHPQLRCIASEFLSCHRKGKTASRKLTINNEKLNRKAGTCCVLPSPKGGELCLTACGVTEGNGTCGKP